MTFRYFEAPESEIAHLFGGIRKCDLCGRGDKCFDLRHALNGKSFSPAVAGCVSCLSAGRFGFFHCTEVGYLDDTGLTWFGEPPMTLSRVFVASSQGVTETPLASKPGPLENPSLEAVEELRRTPTFPSWNEVWWPVHCRDFMVFLGPWQPSDIASHALDKGISPKELFESMVDPDHHQLWIREGHWAFNFFVFRCTNCHKLRAIIDID
jgi:hypothetical protein